ncbi:MAG: 23S rRNA (uracil(1939)-C(5))-methyltransferase RlmD [Oscillospiraceae bacterium]
MDILNKNDIFEAQMTGYTSDGRGVCRVLGHAVFVKGALEGETWRIKILKSAGSVVYAKGEERLSVSPDRAVPNCPLFGACGGCDTMHMSYAEELRFKLGRVNDAFRRIGGLELTADVIVPSALTEGYRNKAIYNFEQTTDGPICGFYRAGSHEVVPLTRCLLQPEASDACVLAVCAWMKERRVSAYDDRSDKGAIRHVFVRSSGNGDVLCCVVSREGLGKHTKSLVTALQAACPRLVGVVLNINKTPGNSVLSGDFYTLWGEGTLTDTLCGLEFSLSPQAFYQINPPQAEKLYALALDFAAPESGDTVLDLYCGAGTISLALAARAGTVIGAEIVPEAIQNASENAERNGITNAEFICADAGDAARELSERGIKPAVVVVDPPRKGMSEEAVTAVSSMSPRRVVYVSCDPATLARDLKKFTSLGYLPLRATAVDMFPRTSHVECVVLMGRGEE